MQRPRRPSGSSATWWSGGHRAALLLTLAACGPPAARAVAVAEARGPRPARGLLRGAPLPRACVEDEPDPALLPSPRSLPALGNAHHNPGGYGPLAKIFYINLDRATDRRASIERQLNTSGVPYERFEAVDAKDVKAGKYSGALRRLSAGVAETKKGRWASIAVALSHRLLYEHILKREPAGNRTFMVLEDDAVLVPDWQARLRELLRTLPQGASSIFCGQWGDIRCSDVISEGPEGLALATLPAWRMGPPERFYYLGATSVLLFRSSLSALLSQLQHEQIEEADINLLSGGSVHTYAMLQPLAHPGEFRSMRRDLNDALA